MASEIILYGPESEPYDVVTPNFSANTTARSPAPSGGPVITASTPVNPQIALPAYRFQYPLGTQLILQDGRKFRYCNAGASTLVVGNVISSAAVITTDQDMTPLTGTLPTGFTGGATVGEKAITFTHGAATTIINFFAEGFVLVTITPGFADTYKVACHIALASAAAGDQVNLWPGHGIRRALTSSSRISLYQHSYGGVIQCAATISGAPVGIAVVAITNAKSGWLQTRGACGVLGTGTLLIGSNAAVVQSGGTAGSVAPHSAGGAEAEGVIGVVQGVEATTQASLIFLQIDG